jgi:hypothetical protein
VSLRMMLSFFAASSFRNSSFSFLFILRGIRHSLHLA